MRSANSPKDYIYDCAILLLLGLMICWFAGEMIWGGKVPFFRDLSTYFYPLRFILNESSRLGELPLWNRHLAMGFPILADFQLGAFYPPHLFFYILRLFDAVAVVYVFHYLVSATGAYVLCRHWNYPRYQAMIGAIIFTFGGTTVSLVNLLNHFQSAVWLPWAVLFWERFLQRESWGRFLIFVAICAMQLLAGSPEIYAMSVALLVLSGIAMQNVTIPRKVLRCFLWLIAANILVIAVASVQLLPAIELILHSRRQQPIQFAEAASWSLNPWGLLNLVFLTKSVDMGLGDGTQLFFERNLPLFVSHYFGAIFIFGICFWVFLAPIREKLVLGFLMAFSLVIAFGAFTPLYPFLYEHVFAFRSFRYPEKVFFVTQAFLLVAVIRGVLKFTESSVPNANKAIWLACLPCALIFVLYLALSFDPNLLAKFIIQQKAMLLPSHWTVGFTASALVNMERQLILVAAVLLLFFVWKNKYVSDWIFRILLVGIVFIDLNWAHQGFQYLLKPRSVFGTPTILETPDQERNRIFYYLNDRNLHAGSFVIARPAATPFNEIYSIVAKNLLPNAGVLRGFDYMQDINALAKESYLTFLKFANQIAPDKQFRLLGALNVAYVTTFRPLETSGITLIRYMPENPSWLYKIDRFVPRAYMVQKSRKESSAKEILQHLSTQDFDPLTEVFLDESFDNPGRNEFLSETKIVSYGNRSVTIHARSNGPGVLVLADSYYPGWHVYVDGEKQKVLRANYFFRAVRLPAGDHYVKFKYEPFWFKVGFYMSLTTILILAVASAVLYFKRRFER